MTSFPKYLRPLEIEAVILIAQRRAKQEEERSSSGRPITDFSYGSPEEIDLAVSTLTKEAATELTALMWLGRGAGGEEADDWADLMGQAADHHIGKIDVEYLASKLPLHEYIEAGLKKLGYDARVPL